MTQNDGSNPRVRFNYGELVALEMALLAQAKSDDEGMTRLEKTALVKIREAMKREERSVVPSLVDALTGDEI